MKRFAGLMAQISLSLAALSGCTTASVPPGIPVSQNAVLGEWSLARVGERRVSRAMTLGFRNDGVQIGSLRCNSMSGRYEVRESAILFPDDVIITAASCPEDWPPNEGEADVATRILFGKPPPMAMLSPDGQRLYFRGGRMLEFVRRR